MTCPFHPRWKQAPLQSKGALSQEIDMDIIHLPYADLPDCTAGWAYNVFLHGFSPLEISLGSFGLTGVFPAAFYNHPIPPASSGPTPLGLKPWEPQICPAFLQFHHFKNVISICHVAQYAKCADSWSPGHKLLKPCVGHSLLERNII